MVDVAALIALAIMAFSVSSGVSREAATFREFGQTQILGAAAFLYPVAPLVLLFGMRHIGIAASLTLAALCFVPGLLFARRAMKAFERPGVDRAGRALKVATQGFGAALAGLIYVAAVAAILVAGYLRAG